jgi:hypothetical protein
MEHPTEIKTGSTERWTLARDIGVLQLKLLVDGLRDLVLVPTSLIVGAFSLFSGKGERPGNEFYRLLAAGKESEHWINLFGALENAPTDLKNAAPFATTDMDELVGKLETFVIDEHRRGGITAQAKNRFDKALAAFQNRKKNAS